MRSRALSAALVGILLVAGACGDDDEDSKATTTTTTTVDYTKFKSTDKVAVSLDGSLLTAAEAGTAVGLQAPPVEYRGRGNSPAPPQGALNVDGIATVFPSEAYKGALEEGKATVGANRTFADPTGAVVLNVLAVKFESAATAQKFVAFATNVATTLGGAKVTAHPELKIGVLPGQVVRVPPSPGATPPTEITVASVLYPNGLYYQMSITGPVGLQDGGVIAFVTAQDKKYQSVKAKLGLG